MSYTLSSSNQSIARLGASQLMILSLSRSFWSEIFVWGSKGAIRVEYEGCMGVKDAYIRV